MSHREDLRCLRNEIFVCIIFLGRLVVKPSLAGRFVEGARATSGIGNARARGHGGRPDSRITEKHLLG